MVVSILRPKFPVPIDGFVSLVSIYSCAVWYTTVLGYTGQHHVTCSSCLQPCMYVQIQKMTSQLTPTCLPGRQLEYRPKNVLSVRCRCMLRPWVWVQVHGITGAFVLSTEQGVVLWNATTLLFSFYIVSENREGGLSCVSSLVPRFFLCAW